MSSRRSTFFHSSGKLRVVLELRPDFSTAVSPSFHPRNSNTWRVRALSHFKSKPKHSKYTPLHLLLYRLSLIPLENCVSC